MSYHQRSAAAQFYMDTGGDYMEEDEGVHMGGRRLSASGPPSQAGRRHSLGTGSNPYTGGDPNDYQDEAEVAELLTKATVTSSEKVKLENLMRVKEIIINKQPALLDNFLNEMLDFQTDNNADVRCYILEFVEDACKTDPETIPKVFTILRNMMLMLQDKAVSVQKKAIQVTAKLYKYTLMWLCRSKSVTDEMEAAWSAVCDIKKYILKLIDSDLDGIRTHAVKFIESIILLQTPSESDSYKRPNDFCLDDVPITVKVARPRKLEEDARNLFEELLKFHASRHATSVNLMTCMGSIVCISKLRPHLMGRVVTAMEKLNVILPPTLERSQVTSVRKYMKVQLIGLLRHSKGIDYYDNITTLLTDLGATNSELHKALPNWDQIRAEKRKRQRAQQEQEQSNQRKRARLQEPVEVMEDYDDDEDVEKPPEKENTVGLSELEQSIFKKLLNPEAAVELVLASMESVPDNMPAHFMSAFTPTDIAGTESRIKHVSRLLAAQITAHQLGHDGARRIDIHDEEIEPVQISTIVSGTQQIPEKEKKLSLIQQPTGASKKKIPKALKLSEVTKPLTSEDRKKHTTGAIERLLKTKQTLNSTKIKLVCSIAASSNFELRCSIMQYIQEEIKERLELGINWLFTEYCLCQEFISKSISVQNESASDRYEWTFFNIMKAILEYHNEAEKTGLAWKLYLEPPLVPDKGLDLLKTLSSQPLHAAKGMQIFVELALKRPKKLHYLSAVLHFCVHAVDEVRVNAVTSILQIYEKMESSRNVIEDQAVQVYCNSLRFPKPPEILFSEDLGRGKDSQGDWSDDLVKSCLSLYLKILNTKNSLIHELAKVYVETPPDVKRSILRYVESPIRNMGMDSPELMKLLDNFPKGAETIITKIIHILTDKTLPSADLVNRVRNLYAKRVSDVRFLIPVLNGLTKQEILSALPKLIKLNPVVVKEVFNRLLGIHADAKTQHASPITPVELMVAVHNVDVSKCDVKTVIKATSLCFNESEVYTPEVLAVVINQLLEQSPLPTLLMRTVIQTAALHPKLSGFILNTLGRLVNKQVWTQPKIWEGFIKCCQRTIPKSIPILLQLPAPQLQQSLDEAPDLKQSLVGHLMSLTQQQRSCLPPTILNVVLGGEGFMKEEYFEGYDDEVTAIGGNLTGPPMSLRSVKEEPRSPTDGDELVMSIKEELQDYNEDQ